MSAETGPTLAAASARLAGVLARENAALAALDFRRAASMLDEKQDAASRFALAWERANPLSPGAEARELAALARGLDAAAAANRRLLEQAITVQGRVLAVIARAVPRSASAPAGPHYRAGGVATAPPRAPLTLSLRA